MGHSTRPFGRLVQIAVAGQARPARFLAAIVDFLHFCAGGKAEGSSDAPQELHIHVLSGGMWKSQLLTIFGVVMIN